MNDRKVWLQEFTTFGDLLKFLRHRAHLTQRDLGAAVGYTESYISRLEANNRIPDRAILTARFFPALAIEDEPDLAVRLLELAKQPATASSQHESEKEEAGRATAGSAPVRLPIQLTSFIGREQEIADLRALVVKGPARLVTLTGAGGVGKTRLAIRVAEEAQADFSAGACLVELATLTNPELLSQAVAAGLGLKGNLELPVEEVVEGYLEIRRLLLVLDNCEHLIAACARLVDHLLRVCPKLVVLATSREALRVAGEQAYRVPSMAFPTANAVQSLQDLARFEAVRLFTERAAAWGEPFELTVQNAPTVAQICRRLDGIPLAIELAASRVGVLSVEQVEARLEKRFFILSAGPRLAIPRHQTLRASIDWSYRLLSENERLLLQRLAVFPGGWTLEAAEAVCGFAPLLSEQVLDLLTALVNQSLVQVVQTDGAKPGSPARYRMLETIRQYACEQLENGPAAVENPVTWLRKRQLDYFSAWIEPSGWELLGPKQIAWVELLISELENLRAVLDWAMDSGLPAAITLGLRLAAAPLYFWYFFGLGKEAFAWLSAGVEALSRSGDLSMPLLGRVMTTMGACLFAMGDLSGARAYLQKSIDLFRPLGPSYDLANTLIWLVFVGPAREVDPEPLKREAVMVARWVGDPGLLGVCLFIGPTTHQDLEEGIKVLENHGDQLFLSDPNRLREHMAILDGDYGLARDCLARTLANNQKYSMKAQIAWDWFELAGLAYIVGDYVGMEAEARACLETAGEISFRFLVCWALNHLGVAMRRQGRCDLAGGFFRRSLDMSCEFGFEGLVLENLAGFGGMALEEGRLADAVRLFGTIGACGIDRISDVARLELARDQSTARLALPEADFQSLWEAGQAMTVDQAVHLGKQRK